jgi:rod shape-determining protein MreC
MVETRGGRRFAILFLVAAFLVLLLGRWLSPVDRVAITVAAPFSAAINGVASWTGDALSGVFDGPGLHSQIHDLEKKNAALIRARVSDAELRRENAIYKRMLGVVESQKNLNSLVANVIGRDSNGIEPDILINKGSRDGLRNGMTVLSADGYFVGAITYVTPNAARVLPMLSPSSSVGAIDVRSRAQGLVEGKYASAPVLDNVDENQSLHPGDIIETSGQCNLFPPNQIIGQVVTVHHNDVSLFQTAVIRPGADFGDLESVLVIRSLAPPVPSALDCKQ